MHLAHKTIDGREQPLQEHLQNVAEMSGDFAKTFDATEYAYLIGLYHDLGKYSKEFQARIRGSAEKVDHSSAGAQTLMGKNEKMGFIAAYCIAGHHAGLPDGGSSYDGSEMPSLRGRMKKSIPDFSDYQKEIQLPDVHMPVGCNQNKAFSTAMLIRMLFSCLVDADYLDTEQFMHQGNVGRGQHESIESLYEKLLQYVSGFAADSPVNQKRAEVLEDCMQKASCPPGLFSLTVPTGGGKTISSLAFALKHAKEHKLQRVIYVIPYTSIIEQTAQVFSEVLGEENVLAHYADADYTNQENEEVNKKYLATENWDMPVVVTTNVQFFESLFACRSSKCRKLHNIASSVVIFDEAQCLPTKYLQACVNTMAELIQHYKTSVVLCTATQPALDAVFPDGTKRKEICRQPQQLYYDLQRVQIKDAGQLEDAKLVEQLGQMQQVLCIVNTRKQAQKLFELMPEKEGLFHLSTLIFPKQRKEIFQTIKERLKQGEPCRVISTSLVEAGVDFDFPCVYRAYTGLDSLMQAAGRCNREGKRPLEESVVYAFQPGKEYKTPLMQQQAIAVFEAIKRDYTEYQNLEVIQKYFQQLFDIKDLDLGRIVSETERNYQNYNILFRKLAADFKIIDDTTTPIFIPLGKEAQALEQQLMQGERNRELFRKMGSYSVNVYPQHLEQLRQSGIIENIDFSTASQKKTEKPQEGIYILRDLTAYSEQTGLALDCELGNGIMS